MGLLVTGGDQVVYFVASQPEGRGFVFSHRQSTFQRGSSPLVATPFLKMMYINISLMK